MTTRKMEGEEQIKEGNRESPRGGEGVEREKERLSMEQRRKQSV